MSAELTLRGLSRDHGDGGPPALRGFDLTVPAGSCAAIVGPSGSGKTTVLRLASGLDAPDTGDVLLDGASVRDVAPERRQMAMVFQRPLLFPHLSVLDNIAFPARVAGASRRAARADAEEYLALVQLAGFGGRRAGELSGGQEQRVAVARALAARPRVLLLDEPFSALDASLRADMYDLLRRVRAVLDPTILLVTHDHAEAAALADTVAVLSAGELVQHDTVDRIYSRPVSLTVSRLMGGRNEVRGVVRGHRHHSALGAVTLPVDVRAGDGEGVLVFRHESVVLTDPDDADDRNDPGDPDGRVRQPRTSLTGTVSKVEPVGARRLVVASVRDPLGQHLDVEVHAEVPPGHLLAPGDEVGIALPPHALTVVDGAARPGPHDDEPSLRTAAAIEPHEPLPDQAARRATR